MLSESGRRLMPSGNEEASFGDAFEELGVLLNEQRRQDADELERELNLYRSGSAPPTVDSSGGIFSGGGGVNAFSEFHGNNNGKGFAPDEEFRKDPAYLSYYYANVNLNPSLPPPLMSREELRVAQSLKGTSSGLGGIGDRRKLNGEAPQLASVLREMKEGLDVVRSKVETLTAKVKANSYPTADGISYLEAKHLLLLSYCQCLVYYLLRKAKGFSIDGHPVVRSLVEIRLFLEKIRPIDKKLQYQIQKLTTAGGSVADETHSKAKESDEAAQKSEDLSIYKPKPDLLVDKTEEAPEDGVYRPPKFAPMSMDDKTTKQERNAARKEKHFLRQATENTYMKDVLDELEDKPEEVRDFVGAESKEQKKFIAQYERQQQVEEELFVRAPRTKEDKKREKHLKNSRSGLMGLTENFYDDIKFLPMADRQDGEPGSFGDSGHKKGRKFKKRKTRH